MCSHFSSDLRESQDRVHDRLGQVRPFAPVATLMAKFHPDRI